jgi:hypothetical protein
MVALADGVYSVEEDETLQAFCEILNLEETVLASVRSTLYNLKQEMPAEVGASPLQAPHGEGKVDPLKPAREWLDQLEVHDPRLARFLCKMIPSQCPFERDVVLFKKKLQPCQGGQTIPEKPMNSWTPATTTRESTPWLIAKVC